MQAGPACSSGLCGRQWWLGPLLGYLVWNTPTEVKCRQNPPAGAGFTGAGVGSEGAAGLAAALSAAAAAAAAASSGETMAMIFFGGTGSGFRSCSGPQ